MGRMRVARCSTLTVSRTTKFNIAVGPRVRLKAQTFHCCKLKHVGNLNVFYDNIQKWLARCHPKYTMHSENATNDGYRDGEKWIHLRCFLRSRGAVFKVEVLAISDTTVREPERRGVGRVLHRPRGLHVWRRKSAGSRTPARYNNKGGMTFFRYPGSPDTFSGDT